MRSLQTLASLVLIVGCNASGDLGEASDSATATSTSTDVSTGSETTGSETTESETTGGESSGLVLTDIDAFQVVAVPLVDAGDEVAPSGRPVPIVAGRALLLRAAVEVPAGWSPQEVELRVDVTQGGVSTSYTSNVMLEKSFDPADASSGLTVEVPAPAVAPGATYALALDTGAESPALRFPAAGEAELSPVETAPIKVHIVPFEVEGRIPDTSEGVVQGFADAVYAYYPTTAVEISVGALQPNPYPDLPPSQVVGDALFDVGVLMEQTDQAPTDVYYYGLIQPAATRDAYEGLTGSSQELEQRAGFAIGAGFGDDLSESTLVHELGHLHFLKHAPCGDPDNVDQEFPHSDGWAHTEGYDVRTGAFIDIDEGTDMMSYCQPRWVSAYHYAKLTAWVQTLKTL